MGQDTATLQLLKDNMANLPGKDVGFAKSLVQQFESKGKLSDKQWYWIGVLAERAQGIPDFTAKLPPAMELGGMAGIIALFSKGAAKLKYPAITLNEPHTDTAVRLTLAAPTSNNPGHVYVKANGVYAAKISPTGGYYPASNSGQKFPMEAIGSLLQALARNPAKAAAAHGHLTGKCCFCNSELTDEKSTSVGYGPTCAKHYGLPWGKSAATTAKDAMKLVTLGTLYGAGPDKMKELL